MNTKINLLNKIQKNGCVSSVQVSKNSKPITVGLVEWTPEMAIKVLDICNTQNRVCPKRAVGRLAADMANDNFGLTHQAIAFDVNGNLLDGQTRLNAVVYSGKTVLIPAFFNLPVRAHTYSNGQFTPTKTNLFTQDLLDETRKRSFSEQLTISQKRSGDEVTPSENQAIQAIVSKIASLIFSERSIPKSQMTVLKDVFEEPARILLTLKKKYKVSNVYSRTEFIAPLVFAYKSHPKEVMEFATRIFSGNNIPDGSPEHILRFKLDDLKFQKNVKSKKIPHMVFNSLRMHVLKKSDVERISGLRDNGLDFFKIQSAELVNSLHSYFSSAILDKIVGDN